MSRRSRQERSLIGAEDAEGSWAVSYGDMLTLLLAFFILFFSVDPQEESKTKLASSLLAILKPLADDQSVAPAAVGQVGIDADLARRLGARITKVGAKVVVEFPGISFFDSGTTNLTKVGEAKLQEFAERFMPLAGQHLLTVVGFTDDRPVKSRKSGARDNLELSVLRAVSAQRRLQAGGIPLAGMRLAGYGVRKEERELHPSELKSLSEQSAQALERRVVLLIEPEVQP